MRFNKKSALRSGHSVFERRQQPHRSERSIAMRKAQSGEIRQDFVEPRPGSLQHRTFRTLFSLKIQPYAHQ
jgi:hypothetical protein